MKHGTELLLELLRLLAARFPANGRPYGGQGRGIRGWGMDRAPGPIFLTPGARAEGCGGHPNDGPPPCRARCALLIAVTRSKTPVAPPYAELVIPAQLDGDGPAMGETAAARRCQDMATATGVGKPATTVAFRTRYCGSGAVGRVPTYAGQTPAAGVTFCPYSRWNSPPAIMLILRDGVCRIITFWRNSVTVIWSHRFVRCCRLNAATRANPNRGEYYGRE